jgi:hypothetical protein
MRSALSGGDAAERKKERVKVLLKFLRLPSKRNFIDKNIIETVSWNYIKSHLLFSTSFIGAI